MSSNDKEERERLGSEESTATISSRMDHLGSTLLDTSTRGVSAIQGMWKHIREISKESSPDLILVEIKGHTFEVMKAFLIKNSHYFKALFEGEIPSERTVSGAYILRDRDPRAFQCLVTFMKYGFIEIPSPVDWRILEAEAYFFGINISEFIPEVMQLNVGGTIFHTTKTTLSKSPHFERMFQNPLELLRDTSGRIFIDQDPTYFGAVLAIFRTNPNWNFYEKSGALLQSLFKGANHNVIASELGQYGILLPHMLIQWLIDQESDSGQLPRIQENSPSGLSTIAKRDSLLGNVIKKVQDQKIK
mmetsp:Transcript_28126/g.36857  ORF Transcript_28126/g.36857 Transcript_28126/m.36857 type:complete len:303 (+) Transcript_28126:137-1045(+)